MTCACKDAHVVRSVASSDTCSCMLLRSACVCGRRSVDVAVGDVVAVIVAVAVAVADAALDESTADVSADADGSMDVTVAVAVMAVASTLVASTL